MVGVAGLRVMVGVAGLRVMVGVMVAGGAGVMVVVAGLGGSFEEGYLYTVGHSLVGADGSYNCT